MLPDLFTDVADSLTQHTVLLHNDVITSSDDVTGRIGEIPIGEKKCDTTHDDVMLNNKGETPLINSEQHDQGELTDSN